MGHGESYLYDLWYGRKRPDPERLMELARVSGVSLLVWYRLAGLLPSELVPREDGLAVSSEAEAMLRGALEEFGVEGLVEVVEWHRRWRSGG
jgi:hypothetical protein